MTARRMGTSSGITPELAYRFDTFFNVVQHRRTAKPDVRMPFHHLKSDGFWSAHTSSGELSEHRPTTAYVVPKPEFVDACRDPEFRRQARCILIATHFEPAERNALYHLVAFGSVDRQTGSVITDGVRSSGNFPSSVAPKVATDAPENGCERLISIAETDAELVRVVEAWPKLSAVVKRMILAALEPPSASINAVPDLSMAGAPLGQHSAVQ